MSYISPLTYSPFVFHNPEEKKACYTCVLYCFHRYMEYSPSTNRTAHKIRQCYQNCILQLDECLARKSKEECKFLKELILNS